MKWVNEHPGLMSFELWCVATGYAPGKPGGGPVFQQLLNFLLVDSVEARGPLRLVADYYSVERGAGPGWVEREGQHDYTKAKTGDRKLHSPVGQALHRVQGGPLGHLSNPANRGFWYAEYASSQKDGAASWQVSVPRLVCSKLNWLQVVAARQESSPMATGVRGTSQSAESQFQTDGRGKSKCQELYGCMASANLTAAIVGLYYYPACEAAANNWVVEQTVGARTYPVRMRMWNPNYALVDGGKLLVSEPLNAEAAWDFEEGPRTVGGKTVLSKERWELGFLLPEVKTFRDDEARGGDGAAPPSFPLEPWRLIRDGSGRASIAPFFGPEKPPSGIGAARAKYKQLCRELSAAWGHVVHEPEPEEYGAYFGFNVPKAHWLYPHFVVGVDELAARGARVGVASLSAPRVGTSR